MAKIKPHQIDQRQKYIAIDNLFEVISTLKTKKEVVEFFLGLFSASESLMFARRVQVAMMIFDNLSYDQIRKELGVGNDNIRKIDQWLHNGDDEHAKWLKKTISKNTKNQAKIKSLHRAGYKPESLLNKYPYHRFISELFGED